MSLLLPAAIMLLASVLLAVAALMNPVPRDVRQRVDRLAGALVHEVAPQQGVTARGRRPPADWVRRVFTFGMPFDWGIVASPLTLVLTGIIAGAGVWLLAQPLLRLPAAVAAPLAAVAFWYVPHRLARREQDRAEALFLAQFADTIDMIVRMLRAGVPISVAVRTVAHESAPPVSDVFGPVADEVELGVSLDEALTRSSTRVGIADYRFFAAAIALQFATGGNLVSTLETLGEIVRKRQTVRLQIRAASAEERVSAYVIAAMPFVVLGGLLAFSPDYVAPLATDRRGNVILILAAGMLVAGFLSMARLMRNAARL